MASLLLAALTTLTARVPVLRWRSDPPPEDSPRAPRARTRRRGLTAVSPSRIFHATPLGAGRTSGMAHVTKPQDLVVRLLDGRSEQPVLALEAGQHRPPFAVGRNSAWTVDAGHVAAAHVLFAFNGSELYLSAVRGERALLDGKPLGRRWVVAPVPCELRFGGARLVVRTRAGDEETVSPLADSKRLHHIDEQHTSIDEARLAEALRLSMEDAHMPATAQVDVPVVAARATRGTPPLPPLRRPAIRAIVPSSLFLRGPDSRSE